MVDCTYDFASFFCRFYVDYLHVRVLPVKRFDVTRKHFTESLGTYGSDILL